MGQRNGKLTTCGNFLFSKPNDFSIPLCAAWLLPLWLWQQKNGPASLEHPPTATKLSPLKILAAFCRLVAAWQDDIDSVQPTELWWPVYVRPSDVSLDDRANLCVTSRDTCGRSGKCQGIGKALLPEGDSDVTHTQDERRELPPPS